MIVLTCKNCAKWAQPCSFLRERRRRGKQAQLLKDLARTQRLRLDPHTSTSDHPDGVDHRSTIDMVQMGTLASDPFGNHSIDRQSPHGSPRGASHVPALGDEYRDVQPGSSFLNAGHDIDLDIFSFLREDLPLISNSVQYPGDASRERGDGIPGSLEGVIDRSLALRIISLYFNHVSALILLLMCN